MEEIIQQAKTMFVEILSVLASIVGIAAWLCADDSKGKILFIIIASILFCTSIYFFCKHKKDKQKDAQIVALERDGHLHSARMVFLSDSPQDTTRAEIGNQNKFHALHSEYRFKIGPSVKEEQGARSDIAYDFLFEFNAGKHFTRGFKEKDKDGKKKRRINFVPYFFGDENYFPQNFSYTLGVTSEEKSKKENETESESGIKYIYEPGVVECVVGDPGTSDLGNKHFLSCKDCDGQNDIYKYPFGDYSLEKGEICHLGFTYERHEAFFWNNPVELFVIIPRLFSKTTENSAKITVEFEDIPKDLIVDVSLEEYPMKLGCRTRIYYFDRDIADNEGGKSAERYTIDTSNFTFNRNSIYAVYIHHRNLIEGDDAPTSTGDGQTVPADAKADAKSTS